MKIFLSFKFTGEDFQELEKTLGSILSILRSKGHEAYCSIEHEQSFKENNKTKLEILQHALDQIDKSDLMLAFISSNEKSEGMLLEIGYAIAKGKILALAIKNGAKTVFLPELSRHIIEFDEVEDLLEKLKAFYF